MADTIGAAVLFSWIPEVPGGRFHPAALLSIAAAKAAVLGEVKRLVSSRRGKLTETIRETEEPPAAPVEARRDLLERVRACCGV